MHDRVEALLEQEGELAAPDLLVFETLAVLRRETLRGAIAGDRASGAVDDLGDLPVELFRAFRCGDAHGRFAAT